MHAQKGSRCPVAAQVWVSVQGSAASSSKLVVAITVSYANVPAIEPSQLMLHW